MNPCDICKRRILHYPGICDNCADERRDLAETQWQPAYEAATSRLNATAERKHKTVEAQNKAFTESDARSTERLWASRHHQSADAKRDR